MPDHIKTFVRIIMPGCIPDTNNMKKDIQKRVQRMRKNPDFNGMSLEKVSQICAMSDQKARKEAETDWTNSSASTKTDRKRGKRERSWEKCVTSDQNERKLAKTQRTNSSDSTKTDRNSEKGSASAGTPDATLKRAQR